MGCSRPSRRGIAAKIFLDRREGLHFRFAHRRPGPVRRPGGGGPCLAQQRHAGCRLRPVYRREGTARRRCGLALLDRARRNADAGAVAHLAAPGHLLGRWPVAQQSARAILGRLSRRRRYSRKPAYHNGTAWPWLLPMACEALAQAWDKSPGAVAAARALLGSMDNYYCQIAWVTCRKFSTATRRTFPAVATRRPGASLEALRVWKLLA